MPIFWAFLAAVLSILAFGVGNIVRGRYLPIPARDNQPNLVDYDDRSNSRQRSTTESSFDSIGAGDDDTARRVKLWKGERMASLDTFRGFMFIMGVSLAFSFEVHASRSIPKERLFARVVQRSAILFLLGLFLVNNKGKNGTWSNLRIMGVLQRFAVAYLVVASLRLLSLKSNEQIQQRYLQSPSLLRRSFADVFAYWTDYIFICLLMGAWFLISFILSAPDCPRGYFGPGGLSSAGRYSNCTGGASMYLDRLVLGTNHMHQRPSCAKLYNTNVPFDPEGILGCLPTIFTVFLGLQAGQVLQIYPELRSKLSRFVCYATVYGIIGGALCGFTQNQGLIPVNKNLWTPSFVFVLCSIGLLILLVLHIVCDVCKLWAGEPFHFVGMNPIAIYLLHEIFHHYLPVQWPVTDSHLALLFMNLWGTVFWTIVAYLMHSKRIYLSV